MHTHTFCSVLIFSASFPAFAISVLSRIKFINQGNMLRTSFKWPRQDVIKKKTSLSHNCNHLHQQFKFLRVINQVTDFYICVDIKT